MKITLKDGSVKEYAEAMTVNDIAYDIAGGLGRAACAGEARAGGNRGRLRLRRCYYACWQGVSIVRL